MERLNTRILLALALASLIFAIAALFFPVKVSRISGVLDSGDEYQAEWETLGYQVVGGYLLLLVGLINIFLAKSYPANATKKNLGDLSYWIAYNLVLVISFFLASRTMFYYWQSWIPPEVQNAIGTPYTSFREQVIRNVPMILSVYISAILWVAILSLALIRRVGWKVKNGK